MVRCQSCDTPVCEICDFVMPGNVHLCPACAANPAPSISAPRRRNVILSYGLAIFSCVIFAMLGFVGSAVDQRSAAAVAGLLGILFLASAVAGLVIGLSAIDRNLSNPWWFWGAVAWNGLLVAVIALFAVVGSLSG